MRLYEHSNTPMPLRDLAEKLAAIEIRSGTSAEQRVISTGWREVDAMLPPHGLLTGAIHEWHGLESESRSRWTPPLSMLAHFAAQAKNTNASERPWLIWIGKRAWVYGHAAMRSLGATDRCLWIDPGDLAARMWAIDVALRCPGVIVIADGSGVDSASSRRLQLAASTAGTICFLARPFCELKEISFAATRWTVHTSPARGVCNRWTLKLVRCKGLQAVDSPLWIIERGDDGWLGCLSSDTAHRSGAAVAAS